jgi:hypothetical protein
MRTWVSEDTDVRRDPVIAQAVIDFIDHHDVRTVTMGERIINCSLQEGIDYQGDWCPVCDFWKGRNRFTGKLLS